MPLIPEAGLAIQAALAALKIDGLPGSMQAGEKVTPRLHPDPLEALAPLALGERTLAGITLPLKPITIPLNLPSKIPITLPLEIPLNLGATLDDITLTAKGATDTDVPGATTLDLTMKAVEFATPALDGEVLNTTAKPKNALPYLTPKRVDDALGVPVYGLGQQVQGILGRVAGTIKQIGRLTGHVAGSVNGTLGDEKTTLTATVTLPDLPKQVTIPSLAGVITTPKLLHEKPTREIRWTVQDESGNELDGSLFSISDPASLAPSLVFLPEFVELTGVAVGTSRRSITCEVTISVETGDLGPDEKPVVLKFDRKLGPFPVEVPKIPLPTVMAFIQHSLGDERFPGGVLIAVPATSQIQGLDQLRALLDPVRSTLNRLKALAEVVTWIAFPEAAGYLDDLLSLLEKGDPKPPAFRRRDRLPDLSDVTLKPGGFLGIGRESFEDTISSVLLVGPPKRTVRVFRQRDYNADRKGGDRGVFDLVVGPTAVAFVKTLSRPDPDAAIECLPSGSVFREEVKPEEGRWNDRISSYVFLPL